MKNDKFIQGIAETMLLVAPISLFKKSYFLAGHRRTFFEIICNKACLNNQSLDVMRAFELAIKKSKEVNK